MMNKSALVILSGGQDSTTCLFWAKQHFTEVHAITFNYNQRHALELEAARTVARVAGVASHEVLDIGPILNGVSPLTDPDRDLETYETHDQMEKVIGDRVELTFVPMRNALFITLAANRAVCLDTQVLVTGVCQADNANYPDCRQSFIDAQQSSINEALGRPETGVPISILTPLMDHSKDASVHFARILGDRAFAALAFTHTAYDGVYPPVGKDHASILRAHGFEKAGLPDPLVLRAWKEGLMPLPSTPNYSNHGVNERISDDVRSLALKWLAA